MSRCQQGLRLNQMVYITDGDMTRTARKLSRRRYPPLQTQLDELTRLKAELERQRKALAQHMAECEACFNGGAS